jgi:hypothetical protein
MVAAGSKWRWWRRVLRGGVTRGDHSLLKLSMRFGLKERRGEDEGKYKVVK